VRRPPSPFDFHLPSQSIRVAPIDDRGDGEADDGHCAKDLRAERARHDELENDHAGAEPQEMPGALPPCTPVYSAEYRRIALYGDGRLAAAARPIRSTGVFGHDVRLRALSA
jgi:hypothetical protein